MKRFDYRHWQVLLNHHPAAMPLPDPAHDLLTDALAHELPPTVERALTSKGPT